MKNITFECTADTDKVEKPSADIQEAEFEIKPDRENGNNEAPQQDKNSRELVSPADQKYDSR